jgi:hypothetical protein
MVGFVTSGPFDGPNTRDLMELLPPSGMTRRLVEAIVSGPNEGEARAAVDTLLQAELEAEYEKLSAEDQAD